MMVGNRKNGRFSAKTRHPITPSSLFVFLFFVFSLLASVILSLVNETTFFDSFTQYYFHITTIRKSLPRSSPEGSCFYDSAKWYQFLFAFGLTLVGQVAFCLTAARLAGAFLSFLNFLFNSAEDEQPLLLTS